MVNDQNKKYLNITPPAAIIDNASATVAEIDTLGFDYLTILVALGATDIAMTALKVTESDSTGADHVDVTGLVFGTSTNLAGSTSALPTVTDDDELFAFQISLVGRKRYIDVTATLGDGALGTYITLLAILSRAKEIPATAAEAGVNQILRV